MRLLIAAKSVMLVRVLAGNGEVGPGCLHTCWQESSLASLSMCLLAVVKSVMLVHVFPDTRVSLNSAKEYQFCILTSTRISTSRRRASRGAAQVSHRAGIPAGYSFKNWDPREEPILLLGSVFDAYSLGKWIYDCTVLRYA